MTQVAPRMREAYSEKMSKKSAVAPAEAGRREGRPRFGVALS